MAKKQPYLDASGAVVPGVTTILSRFKDSGGLLFWAFKKGMAYGLEGKAGAKLYDDVEARDAGTIAHEMVENYLNGRPVESKHEASPTAVAKGTAAFDTFLKWQKMTALEFRHTEVPLVSEANKYGGKLDAIGLIGNELVLVDFKTSNSVYLDYTLQLAAYGLLWNESYPDTPITGGYHLIRFAKEEGDFGHHFFPRLDQEMVAFLQMRKLFDLVKQCEKRVR